MAEMTYTAAIIQGIAEEMRVDPKIFHMSTDAPGPLVKEFGEAALGLEENALSDLVQSKYGFHIIQLLEKRDKQPLEEVRPGIERLLSRNAVRDYREKLRTEAGLPSPCVAKDARRPNPHQRGKVNIPPGAGKGNKVPPTAGKPTQVKPAGASGK